MKKRKAIGVTVASLIIALSLVFSSGCGGLGLITAIGCAGCTGSLVKEILKDEPATIRPEPSTRPEKETPAHGDDSSDVTSIVYKEYDPTAFNEMCAELTELASGNDFNEIKNLYTELYNEYEYIDENSSMLFVLYTENVTDEYYSEQYTLDDARTTELTDTLLTAIKAVCDGPCSGKFKEFVGEKAFDCFNDYSPMTEEQLELTTRESELVDEYNTAVAEGVENGTDDAELNKILGGIYIELVQLRTQLAKSYGYDNYADFADNEIYCRDFSGQDLEHFYSSVKKISADVYNMVFYSTAGYADYLVDTDLSASASLALMLDHAANISPYTENAVRLMNNEHLYSIGGGSERREGAYTISFAKKQKPFIFANVDGEPTDFITFSHEFGHFTADTVKMNPNLLIYGYGSLELSEIHSNGLQALLTKDYGDIYGNDAGLMAAYNVVDLLENVTDGCLMDEFQRKIYHNPDMTLDQINSLYRSLSTEYGLPADSNDYWWMYVNHNFEAPMYYISYAASAIVALQIWTYTINDYDKAVELWEQLIEIGSYDMGYLEAIDEIGLSDFTNEPVVLMTCRQALSFVANNSFSLTY